MANGDASGATQFEFYEGIRIILPGALTVGLANEVSRTFHLGIHLENNPVGGIAAAILIGLIFYFIDAPAKAAVYYQNLPTEHLKDLGITAPAGYRLENLYFVLHDEVIPKSIRARGLYMGSMYRIGLEAIYMLMFTAVGVLVTATILTGEGIRRINPAHPSWVPGVVGIIASVFFVPYSAELESRRRRSGRTIPGEISESIRKQAGKVDLTLVICLVLQVPFVFDHKLFLPAAVISVVVALLWWSMRYFKGYKIAAAPRGSDHGGSNATDLNQRRPLTRISAVTAAAAVALLVEFDAVLLIPAGSSITTFDYWEWTLAIVLALGLICARGHEKRLGGSYATQNTWLSLHKDELANSYFSGRPPRIIPVDSEGTDSED